MSNICGKLVRKLLTLSPRDYAFGLRMLPFKTGQALISNILNQTPGLIDRLYLGSFEKLNRKSLTSEGAFQYAITYPSTRLWRKPIAHSGIAFLHRRT
jgi:hypothetical protein